jgi:hypothetical protein
MRALPRRSDEPWQAGNRLMLAPLVDLSSIRDAAAARQPTGRMPSSRSPSASRSTAVIQPPALP